jgi:hypothetical protein
LVWRNIYYSLGWASFLDCFGSQIIFVLTGMLRYNDIMLKIRLTK